MVGDEDNEFMLKFETIMFEMFATYSCRDLWYPVGHMDLELERVLLVRRNKYRYS